MSQFDAVYVRAESRYRADRIRESIAGRRERARIRRVKNERRDNPLAS